jgi:hypothetical protein
VLIPKHVLVVEVNRSGSIVGSLHDPGAVRIGAVTEAFEFNRTFFIGHDLSFLSFANVLKEGANY